MVDVYKATAVLVRANGERHEETGYGHGYSEAIDAAVMKIAVYWNMRVGDRIEITSCGVAFEDKDND